MLKIVVVGLSYKTSPVELREKFSFSKTSLLPSTEHLLENDHLHECCIISTCNRVEIYAVTDDEDICENDIFEFLCEYSNLPVDSFKQNLYSLRGSDAVRHIFRVASGMESMVIGEPQILGQVKEHYKTAFENQKTGLILNRLFNKTFFIAKKIRTETSIASQAISVSYLAVELAKRIFEDLNKRSVMLVGTGDMSELAAKHLISSGIKDLYITSRNINNAISLAERLNGNAFKIEELFYYLNKVDILITATGSSDYIIKADHIKESLKLRKNEPMFFIDIAVPRDIDPKINSISGVYLYDIDDLKGVSEENLKFRKQSINEAEQLVANAESNFTKWMQSLKVFPTIVDLKNRFEKIKEEELEKTLRKLEGLDPKQQETVEKLASSLIGKLLHKPITNLKKESSTYNGVLYTEILKSLYELEKENFLESVDDNEAQDRN